MADAVKEPLEMDAKKIEELKRKHGDVFKVEVDGRAAYLKKPSRHAMSLALLASKTNPIRYGEILLENCWLEGDEEIKTDDSLFLAVLGTLDRMIEIKEAELKKL